MVGTSLFVNSRYLHIDFSEIPENCASYREYIGWILEGIKKELAEAFPKIVTDTGMAVWYDAIEAGA